MKICPISYEDADKSIYSINGLKSLSKRLKKLEILPLSADEQRKEAFFKAAENAIQGLHPKLSSELVINNDGEGYFKILEKGGTFILKPQSDQFYELPQNEDITMRLAETVQIEVPLHGLIYCKGGTFTYFIKRFDRTGRNERMEVEDFSALAGKSRETKYDYTMEGLADIINSHCTFPALEKLKLLKLTLFNYLVGNEDMHLKNFSLIRRNNKVELTPAYDLVNSTIAMGGHASVEIALSLNGKKKGFTREDFIDYYGKKILGQTDKSIVHVLIELQEGMKNWEALIFKSFLSDMMKQRYWKLVSERKAVLFPKG